MALTDGAAAFPGTGGTLVLGTGVLARKVVRACRGRRRGGDVVVGVVAEGTGPAAGPIGAPVLGSLADLDAVLARTAPGRVVVAIDERRGRLPGERLLEARLRGVAVEDAVTALERLSGKIAIEAVSPGSLACASGFGGSRLHAALARVVSLAAAVAGLILLSPLMLLIALLIVLDSPGPALFVQERAGLAGRRFPLLKFRTMREATDGTSLWVRDNHDRITRVGRWLRAFRLDELPQFVNILRGDMNLVGPRPHPAANFDMFMKTVPFYRLRAMVRPGVTGWAQVRYGYANGLAQETEKMRYDLYYIKRRSILLDLRILLETVRVVLLGGGAAAPAAEEPERAPAPRFGGGASVEFPTVFGGFPASTGAGRRGMLGRDIRSREGAFVTTTPLRKGEP